jgi:hypothetical protein
MKLAIMQPYLFPYIGYFQLISAVDKFVVYDDVNFIKQGWINRNNILLNNQRHLFTVPVESITSFKKINEVHISAPLYKKWNSSFKKTLQNAYKKAPCFDTIYPMVTEVLDYGEQSQSISSLCFYGIKKVCDYLNILPVFQETSSVYGNDDLRSAERVLDICKRENAGTYINAIGGMELYSKEQFKEKNIDLYFLQPEPVSYPQFKSDFVSHLSIIDSMMFNSREQLSEMIQQYKLV